MSPATPASARADKAKCKQIPAYGFLCFERNSKSPGVVRLSLKRSSYPGMIMLQDPKREFPVDALRNTVYDYIFICKEFVVSNIRDVFILSWMAIWLYLSLASVVTSFAAIQLQPQTSKAEQLHISPGLWRRLTEYDKNKEALERFDPQSDDDRIARKIKAIEGLVQKFESSEDYKLYDELEGYKSLSEKFFPWMSTPTAFPILPHPALILIVTLSMGALGSVLFMLQLHLVESGQCQVCKQSVSYHLFRPFQGMAAALAIYLLVKAGQMSIAPGAGMSGNIDGDINVFVLGILGVISGLVSDRAIDRISAAGISMLTMQSTESRNNGAASKAVPEKPEIPSDSTAMDKRGKAVLQSVS